MTKCFFSGIEIKKANRPNVSLFDTETKEHLVGLSRAKSKRDPKFKSRIRRLNTAKTYLDDDSWYKHNVVKCCSYLNFAIGRAPLKVKFELKKALESQHTYHSKNIEQRMLVVRLTMKMIADKYTAEGCHMPCWVHKQGSGKKNVASYKLLMSLMTKEEIQLGSYFKMFNHDKIIKELGL